MGVQEKPILLDSVGALNALAEAIKVIQAATNTASKLGGVLRAIRGRGVKFTGATGQPDPAAEKEFDEVCESLNAMAIQMPAHLLGAIALNESAWSRVNHPGTETPQ